PPLSTLFPYTTLFRSGRYYCSDDRKLLLFVCVARATLRKKMGGAHGHRDDRRVQERSENEKDDDEGHGLEHRRHFFDFVCACALDRKSTRLNSSHVEI